MFMLAGPNGAGKSTLYETVIRPRVAAPFINADVIQRDELRDPSMQASYRAAEIAEERRRTCLRERLDFVSESTFSHPSKLDLIREAGEAGFRVVMFHVNVRSADLSVKRVAHRAQEGGHDVPEDKIRERYVRNQALIRQAVLKADFGYVYDNSGWNTPPVRTIKFEHGQVKWIADRVPAWARELYAKELERFSPARLNAPAASFADARAIVAKLAGPQAVLRIPPTGKAISTSGEIVAETSEHWVQRASEAVFFAHFKAALPKEVKLHGVYEITYPSQGRGVVRRELPEPPGRAMASHAVQNDRSSPELARSRTDVQAAAAERRLIYREAGGEIAQVTGTVAFESSHHLLVQISPLVAVGVEKQQLDRKVEVGQDVALRFERGKGQVIDRSLEPDRGSGAP